MCSNPNRTGKKPLLSCSSISKVKKVTKSVQSTASRWFSSMTDKSLWISLNLCISEAAEVPHYSGTVENSHSHWQPQRDQNLIHIASAWLCMVQRHWKQRNKTHQNTIKRQWRFGLSNSTTELWSLSCEQLLGIRRMWSLTHDSRLFLCTRNCTRNCPRNCTRNCTRYDSCMSKHVYVIPGTWVNMSKQYVRQMGRPVGQVG
jgi:hypothetical protein